MFNLPTLPQLIQQARADLIDDAADALRRSDAEVFARTNAGAVHGLYGYLAWQAQQLSPVTCDDDQLETRFGYWLPEGRKLAVAASGTVQLSGQAGVFIAGDTLLQRSDGVRFRVTQETLLTTEQIAVPVAAEDRGQHGNTRTGSVLQLVSPILSGQRHRSGLLSSARVEGWSI